MGEKLILIYEVERTKTDRKKKRKSLQMSNMSESEGHGLGDSMGLDYLQHGKFAVAFFFSFA